MDKKTFIDTDPCLVKAAAKVQSLRSGAVGRWGEARRFAGQRASNRLEKIERAEQAWSRAYDRAAARFDKMAATAA